MLSSTLPSNSRCCRLRARIVTLPSTSPYSPATVSPSSPYRHPLAVTGGVTRWARNAPLTGCMRVDVCRRYRTGHGHAAGTVAADADALLAAAPARPLRGARPGADDMEG
eukprot:5151357-Pyramimonas_sp.AAC.2